MPDHFFPIRELYGADGRPGAGRKLGGQAMGEFFSEVRSVEVVNGRMGQGVSPRLAQVMESLVRHMHAFVKEVELSQDEWAQAVDFLTRTGQICTGERQEFILLSDVLGVSMLVDAVGNRRPVGATENTVLGPFHVADAPVREPGASICLDGKGETCHFLGRVLDTEGKPIAGACVDVWSDNADGFYDVQQPGIQPRWNNRGRFFTDAEGKYSFRGIKPVSYPIPDDGPVGQLLQALGRHPYRPAHMHFIITAAEHQTIITHTFDGADAYLGDDAVFGVKASLVAPFVRSTTAETDWISVFDFVMVPA